MIKKLTATGLLLLAVAGGLWAVGRSSGGADNPERVQVAASYYPLYEFVRQVGGNHVQAINMTPNGVEPHDYEPSAKDLATAETSDMFVYNGVAFEAWTEDFIQNYNGLLIRASEFMTLKPGHADGHELGEETDEHAMDPHFWLDPVLARQIVNNIRDGLIKADPAHAEDYLRNAANYNKKLVQLDEAFRDGLAKCEQRTIVVSHQSMNYLAARYGLTVQAIAGISPETEPDASRLAELSTLVREKQIAYVFFESLVSSRLADTIAKEAGVSTLTLDPLEGLNDEAQKSGKDYISIQRQNLSNLRHALACR